MIKWNEIGEEPNRNLPDKKKPLLLIRKDSHSLTFGHHIGNGVFSYLVEEDKYEKTIKITSWCYIPELKE